MRIAIIEPNAATLSVLAYNIAADGHEVVTSHDVIGVQNSAARFDLVLLDLDLPKHAAYELLESGAASISDAFIVGTSSCSLPASQVQAVERGVHQYLHSPYSLEVLLNRICELHIRREHAIATSTAAVA